MATTIDQDGIGSATAEEMAPADAERCERCSGTGRFITGSLNGKLTGPGGICFRCGGKGHQTLADRRRNYGYDNWGGGGRI